MPKKNIIWLASYPKSGNTWFRVFLTNLINDSDQPANINDLKEATIASSRKLFDEYTGLSSADLTFEEIDKLRPDVYRMQSEESEDLLFKKVHDKYYYIDKNQALFPSEITKGVIYLIRNPLDVLVSFAYHSAKPMGKMVETINDSNYAFCSDKGRLQNQLRQLLGSWSDHVKSWTEQNEIPVFTMRYEDMILDTFKTFKNAVDFIGLDFTSDQIEAAIQKSDFKVLSEQEKQNGFKEKMIKSTSFFRKGLIGDWVNHIDNETKNLIVTKHFEVLKKFGYVDENGNLKF